MVEGQPVYRVSFRTVKVHMEETKISECEDSRGEVLRSNTPCTKYSLWGEIWGIWDIEWNPGRHLSREFQRELLTHSDNSESMALMLLMSTKEGGHSPTHTPILSDAHTSLILIFLNFILVSLLTSWYLSTAVHITTESNRVVEGENILFLVHDLPDNTKSLVWFKALRNVTEEIAAYALPYNLSRPGPLYSGRETIYRNGSLMIENINLKDTGFYILQTYNRRKKVISTTTMYLQVNGKWFIVISVNWVRFISLNTERRVVCAYYPYELCCHLGVWAFSSGHKWCRIMIIDQNASFDFTLHTCRCKVGKTAKVINLSRL